MSNSKNANANKFAAILNARQTARGGEESASEPVATEVLPAPVAAAAPTHALTPARKRTLPLVPGIAAVAAEETPKRMGRTPGQGKSSDPRFKQVTAYIPHDLHENATIALRLANQVRIDAEKEDFSELLTRLLSKWYEGQNYYKPTA